MVNNMYVRVRQLHARMAIKIVLAPKIMVPKCSCPELINSETSG